MLSGVLVLFFEEYRQH